MNTSFLLAAAEYGDPTSLLFQHFGVSFFLLALLSFFLGVLVGWLAWRYCKRDAQRIEAENKRLEEEFKAARRSLSGLETRVNELDAA